MVINLSMLAAETQTVGTFFPVLFDFRFSVLNCLEYFFIFFLPCLTSMLFYMQVWLFTNALSSDLCRFTGRCFLVFVGFGWLWIHSKRRLAVRHDLSWVPALTLAIIANSIAGGRAGCCMYPSCACCGGPNAIFHDQPIAKCGHSLHCAAVVLLGFLGGFMGSSWTCLLNGSILAPYCMWIASWTLLCHSNALASTILFCKNEKERPKEATQSPVQGGVQMQAVQTATIASVGVQPATVMQVCWRMMCEVYFFFLVFFFFLHIMLLFHKI